MVTLADRLFPASVMPDRDWWHSLWPNPDAVVKTLGIEVGMDVIDLACGDGYFTAAIARRVGSGTVVGIDLDPAMLKQAAATCAGLENCRLRLGDAMEVAALVSPADYILIANTFHGVPDKEALAQGAAKALKPGGRFAIVNWHPIARERTPVLGQPRGPRTELRMSVAQTRQVVEAANLALERTVELPPYHYAAVFAKPA